MIPARILRPLLAIQLLRTQALLAQFPVELPAKPTEPLWLHPGLCCGPVSYSLDGDKLAAIRGEASRSIFVWQMPSGSLFFHFSSTNDTAFSTTVFTRDGQALLAGATDVSNASPSISSNSRVVEFDLADGHIRREYSGHTQPITCLAVAPTIDLLASGSRDSTIKLWMLNDGGLHRTLTGHTAEVTSLAFSTDGSILISAGRDRTIRVWRLIDHELVATLTTSDSVGGAVLLPDGKTVVSVGNSRQLEVWDWITATRIKTIARDDPIPPIVLSSSGDLLAVGAFYGGAMTIDTASWQALAQFPRYNPATGMAFSPSGDQLAMSGIVFDCGPMCSLPVGQVNVYALPQAKLLRTLNYCDTGPTVFTSDQSLLASATQAGYVNVYQVSNGSLVRQIDRMNSEVRGLVFSQDRKLLACGYSDGTIRIIGMTDGKTNLVLNAGRPAEHLAFSRDGSVIVAVGGPIPSANSVSSDDYLAFVHLWRTGDGQRLWTKRWNQDGLATYYASDIFHLEFSPDGTCLALGGATSIQPVFSPVSPTFVMQAHFALLNEANGETLWGYRNPDMPGLPTYCSALRFSPDGKQLAVSGFYDQGGFPSWQPVAQLWNLANGRMETSLPKNRPLFTPSWASSGLEFSPDSNQLIALTSNVEIWNIKNQTLQDKFSFPSVYTFGAALSPGGDMISLFRDESLLMLRMEGGIPIGGSLRVLINPPEAMDAGAHWRRVGTETWFAGGSVENGIPAGNYVIEFQEVGNYAKPFNQQVSISTGQETLLSVTYGEGSISGHVWDAGTSQPISGATITASGCMTNTDATGFYTLTNVSVGMAFVQVSAEGYVSTNRLTNVSLHQTTSGVDFSLQTPALPIIALSPPTLDFSGQFASGQTGILPVKISNNGRADLNVSALEISNCSSTICDLSVFPYGALNLRPGESTTINVQFKPQSFCGEQSANLLITHNAQAPNPITVNMKAGHPDSDGDGIPDDWETNGVWIEGVKLDLPAMGADPQHKDIFVEVDYMDAPNCSHLPKANALQKVIDAFQDAPVTDLRGEKGINIHIDAGPDSIMNPKTQESWGRRSRSNRLDHRQYLDTAVGADNWLGPEFNKIKGQHFGTERLAVFHYCLFVHSLDPQKATVSGMGFVPGGDFIVSLGGWGSNPGTEYDQAAALMHELGHNLALDHGGRADSVNYKPNYLSVMNYPFQISGLRIHDQDQHLDYSRFVLPDLDEDHLDETVGLAGVRDAFGFGTRFYDKRQIQRVIDEVNIPIDWSWDSPDPTYTMDVKVDINNDSMFCILKGGTDSDWDNLVFDGPYQSFASGSKFAPTIPTQELTVEMAEIVPHQYYVAVSGLAHVFLDAGRSRIYEYRVKNMGTLDDTYDLQLKNVLGWVGLTDIPRSLRIASGDTVSIPVRITIPTEVEVGTIDVFTISLTSLANPLVSDSGTTSIELIKPVAFPILNWSNPHDIIYGHPIGGVELNATADMPGIFIYSPAIDAVLKAGAGQVLSVSFLPTDTNYAPVVSIVKINVLKASQSIVLEPLPNRQLGSAPFKIRATASSGLPVSLQVLSGPATFVDDLLTLTNTGKVVIRASQGGNANYASAPNIEQSFHVITGSVTLYEPHFAQKGLFGFKLQGPPNTNYRLEGSTNQQSWISLLTTNSSTGSVEWTDPESRLLPSRFYRAVIP